MTESLADKYDRLAPNFAKGTYANLTFDMERRRHLAMEWGSRVVEGDSVLELGCGDGALAELFVRRGLRYSGTDLSPQMVRTTSTRLEALGAVADVFQGDVSELALARNYDLIVSYMGAFFSYVVEPVEVLRRFRPRIAKKIVVDVNPRIVPLKVAIGALESARYRDIRWRPFFVPMTVRLPTPVLQAFTLAESIPVLRRLPLRWKFLCLIAARP